MRRGAHIASGDKNQWWFSSPGDPDATFAGMSFPIVTAPTRLLERPLCHTWVPRIKICGTFYTTEYDMAANKNEILPFETAWSDL